MKTARYDFRQDKRGMLWDLLLYIPTVVFLLSMAAKFWYGGNPNMAYLFMFLGSFFFIAGANRILKTRMMLIGSAPVAIEVSRDNVQLIQRDGQTLSLLKDIKYYPDYSGRSFGLAGLDGQGQRQQFVLHRGQFGDEKAYGTLQETLRKITGA